ncbi:globin domain-containing protein [Streptomyces oceani]|uniref:nitric oxide dioxygenase n=1 Tax=Streptomyces oceani TaxID=1075402 RepID=A0A1E7KK35_9ACTN|nr:globin domain-containing protein [Streptomyces oceani]OEV04224.1 hemin transporter [Streptomyces oceani]
MLSEESAATIRATLPTVSAAVDEITTLLYERMFAEHPELRRDLFNRGNQANGAQQRALAGAIATFASALVERPGVRPDALLSRVAHKHASLGITSDQYVIVHRHLFAAIREVLGTAVTEKVARAWDEVYWLMAGALIALESRLYAESGTPDGDVWRTYEVIDRHPETADTEAFVVRPTDGSPVPASKPGQYVSVRLEMPDGARQIRQYSLTDNASTQALRFAVRRVTGDPDGEVSHGLHERVRPGDTLRISLPRGDVQLDDSERPVLLASAGIGCTPMISMLNGLAATDSARRVIALHADRSERTHAFRADLEQLVGKLSHATQHVWYETPEGPWPSDRTGRMDLSTLELPAHAVAYLCGPLPFLRSCHAQLLAQGLAPADSHYEVFGPDLVLDQD